MVAFVFLALNVTLWLQALALWCGAIIAIITVAGLLRKSPVGRAFGWFWKRIFSDPLTDTFNKKIADAVTSAVAPSLESLRVDAARLEEKNDTQHGENKAAILRLEGKLEKHSKSVERFDAGLEGIKYLVESINDRLDANARMAADHFGESAVRDMRIIKLEEDAKAQRAAIAEALHRDRQATVNESGPVARVDAAGQ